MPPSLVRCTLAAAAIVSMAAAVSPSAQPALPTQAILDWFDDDIGVIIHFNMATMAHIQGCNGQGTPPPASAWDASQLDTDQWAEAIKNLGAKYAVYVAKHGCGWLAWKSKVTLPFLPGPEHTYPYTVAAAGDNATDVAAAFVASCHKAGVKPGFYYSLGSNAYAKNTLKLSDADYNTLVVAQTQELWSKFGPLGEIWFDGGYSPAIAANLTASLGALQPGAVVFQGYGVSPNPTRWIGTEAGTAPYPNWSANDANMPGAGAPDGPDFVPGEVDMTMQTNDLWFYSAGHPIHTLADLQVSYHHSVGRNANLLLDIAPTPQGRVDDAAFARYKEFGDWVRACYGPDNVLAEATDGSFEVDVATVTHQPGGASVDRVVIQEDQTQGERITGYTVQVQRAGDGGEWLNASSVDGPGQSVGHKRIHLFSGVVDNVTAVRVVVDNSTTPVTALRRLAVVGVTACGSTGPGPAPAVCAVPAAGQSVGLFTPTYGANVKWIMKAAPAAAAAVAAAAASSTLDGATRVAPGAKASQAVTFQLDGLSSSGGGGGGGDDHDAIDLCLTVSALLPPLPPAGASSAGSPSPTVDSPGAYSNGTSLAPCVAGSQDQVFLFHSDTQQVEFAPTQGCFDCAYCQLPDPDSRLQVFSPCWTPASPNEQWTYDPLTGQLAGHFNSKVVGVCAPKNQATGQQTTA